LDFVKETTTSWLESWRDDQGSFFFCDARALTKIVFFFLVLLVRHHTIFSIPRAKQQCRFATRSSTWIVHVRHVVAFVVVIHYTYLPNHHGGIIRLRATITHYTTTTTTTTPDKQQQQQQQQHNSRVVVAVVANGHAS
jgi:hypothetical protein